MEIVVFLVLQKFSRINISLRKNPIWQNIRATYKFQKDNKEEYLCALEIKMKCNIKTINIF